MSKLCKYYSKFHFFPIILSFLMFQFRPKYLTYQIKFLMTLESIFLQTEALQYLGIGTLVIFLLVLVKKYFSGTMCDIKEVNLQGKYAVITGGNSGIGAQTTKFLASKGCTVLIGARDKQTAEQVIKECKKNNPQSNVEFFELNLASWQSIRAFVKSVSYPKIDFMVNNAGIMAIPKRKTTAEGFEMQWGVNHLGHFYLTYLLWNKIAKSNNFRVVNVSSLAHKKTVGFFGATNVDFQNINFQKNYDPNLSYSRSKLYNVLFTHALASKIDPKQGKVVSLHPGVVRTNLLRQITSEGFGKVMNVFLFFLYPLYWFFTKSSFQGCQTTLHALLSEDVENGSYYADCRKDSENRFVTQENWEKLWDLSEKALHIDFKV